MGFELFVRGEHHHRGSVVEHEADVHSVGCRAGEGVGAAGAEVLGEVGWRCHCDGFCLLMTAQIYGNGTVYANAGVKIISPDHVTP